MDAKEIVKAFREHAEWAQANEWERPITLGDVLRKAADTIEELNNFQGSQCAKLLAQLSELRAENARLRAERDKAVEDINLVFGRVRALADCDGYHPYENVCDLCAFFDGGEKRECHGNCKNARWRGTEGKA